MAMVLQDEEPDGGPWRAVPVGEVAAALLAAAGDPPGRPRIVAVDGRGASGKSTLGAVLAEAFGSAAVVHTDDIAWHESFFGWAHLLAAVLEPLRRGESVAFRPPAWEARGRPGSVDVPAGLSVVLVEGVGASQRELAGLIDASVWVQSDFALAEARGIERDVATGENGDRERTVAFWHEWMSEELPFLARDRPWDRATLTVAGTPPIPLAPGELALGATPARRGGG